MKIFLRLRALCRLVSTIIKSPPRMYISHEGCVRAYSRDSKISRPRFPPTSKLSLANLVHVDTALSPAQGPLAFNHFCPLHADSSSSPYPRHGLRLHSIPAPIKVWPRCVLKAGDLWRLPTVSPVRKPEACVQFLTKTSHITGASRAPRLMHHLQESSRR